MFFDSWQGLMRILIVAPLAYAVLVLTLRVSGKRTLAKMSAFDLVVTVALGSILATIILSKEVALVEGILAFVSLIVLQFAVAWLSVRSKRIRHLVQSDPSLLLYKGQLLSERLLAQRVTPADVRAAIRAQGIGRVEDVGAVVLESDGSFTVIPTLVSQATALEQGLVESSDPTNRWGSTM